MVVMDPFMTLIILFLIDMIRYDGQYVTAFIAIRGHLPNCGPVTARGIIDRSPQLLRWRLFAYMAPTYNLNYFSLVFELSGTHSMKFSSKLKHIL